MLAEIQLAEIWSASLFGIAAFSSAPSLIGSATIAHADDWPQILGPNRDGQAPAARLNDWTTTPPSAVWQVDVGAGYAGPAISDEPDARVVLPHRKGDEELLSCFALATGKVLWEAKFPANYRTTIDPDDGPRCPPVIAKDRVLYYGAAGDLRCVELATGKTLWEQPLRATYNAPDGYFGAGSTPLVIGSTIIACIGGREAAVVGLDLQDGRLLWKYGSMEASYAAPTIVMRGSQPLSLCVLRLETVLLDPTNGKELAKIPFGQRGPTVNAATPIVSGATSLLTASYGIGAVLVDWSAEPKTIWRSDNALSSQYPTPVLLNASASITKPTLLGIHGREDQGVAALRLVDWQTGKVNSELSGFGMAHLIATPDDVLALKVAGSLVRLKPASKSIEVVREISLPATGDYRALPALAHGMFCCRSTSNGSGKLVALRVGNP